MCKLNARLELITMEILYLIIRTVISHIYGYGYLCWYSEIILEMKARLYRLHKLLLTWLHDQPRLLYLQRFLVNWLGGEILLQFIYNLFPFENNLLGSSSMNFYFTIQLHWKDTSS